MALSAGTRLGPYEIVSALGAGGMGEVYRARDWNLNRFVALKVLPASIDHDVERLARFRREAQLLATLNHPYIAQIYGFEDSGGTLALAMELVDGPTLAERIARGAVPVAEAVAIARQLVDALEAAHEQGIVHRDLKPANIKIRRDGTVRVLDFGLAKLTAHEQAGMPTESDVSALATREASLHTMAGLLVGTVSYMAPEQARGAVVDKRADIWAFGCVLYEMLARRRPFPGDTTSDILAAVLERQPDWAALPTSTPPAIGRLLRRCLDKDPTRRLRDIGDARHDLQPSPDAQLPASASAGRRTLIVLAAAAIVTAVLAGAAIIWLTRVDRGAAPQVTRLSIPLAVGDIFNIAGQPPVAVSPDGHRIAFAINQRLFQRTLDQLEAQAIAGTEPPPSLGPGRGPNWAHNPFFSPDGQWVGFTEGQTLKKIPATGGAAIVITTGRLPVGPASWLPDDTILYGTTGSESVGGIWRVPASGGTPQRVISTKPGEWAMTPQMLPGGTDVLFTLSPSSRTDDADVVVQSLATGARHVVLHGGHSGRYLDSGHLIYGRDSTLFAVRYDRIGYKTLGTPVPVVSNVAQEAAAGAWGGLEYSLSNEGTLVYLPESAVRLRRVLEWVDRLGHGEPLPVEPRAYEYPRISPDGQRVLLDLRDQQNDAWVWEFARGTLTRVTFDRRAGGPAVWTRDGSRVIVAPDRDGIINLFWQPLSGGAEERLLTSANTQFANVVTPDGRQLILEEVDPQTKCDLRILALSGPRVSTPLLQTAFNEQNPDIAPDGKWLAYQSDESGRAEVYVRPFPGVQAARWLVSTSGGTRPLWSRDGRELFYLDLDRRLTVVAVQTRPTFKNGAAHTLFDTKPFGGTCGVASKLKGAARPPRLERGTPA